MDGGVIEAVCKMAFGNGLGAAFNTDYSLASYVEKNYGNIIVEVKSEKDLGFKSAAKLNQIMNLNGIIFKNKSGTWCPYAEYEWLITNGYADYKSYEAEKAKPCLKWTEKGRKWIVNNYNGWVMKLVG